MGAAIDTVLATAHNPGSTVTAAAAASGDSLTVRSFPPAAFARLEQLIRGGSTAGIVQVKSPMLYDNVEGLQYETSESPSAFLLPDTVGQPLVSADTLSVGLTGGTAEYDQAGLSIYYSDLPGSTSRLHSWGDVSGLITNIKGLKVACEASATVGDWSDTVITTTEDLLKADTDHAVLGYVVDTEVTAVAVKGQDTGNLRVAGWGSTSPLVTSGLFVDLSNSHGTPHIPVINSNNKGNTYVSVADVVASTATNVTLVLAELSQNLTS